MRFTNNKSRFIDLQKGKLLCEFNINITTAQFSEDQNLFVLIDDTLRLHIIKDYLILIIVDANIFFPRIYLSLNEFMIIVRRRDNVYFLFDVNQSKCAAQAKKIRELKKGLKYRKKDILISCLNYIHHIG